MMEQQDKQNETTPATGEEAADFARVQAMAAQGEPEPGAEPVQVREPEAPKVDAAESMAGLLGALGMGAGALGMKRTAEVWSEETAAAVAGATVPVLRKYPWGQRVLAFFEEGTGAEEMALAMVLWPVGAATYKAVQADMAGPEPEQPAAPPARLPVVKTQTTGAPADLGALVEVHGHANE